jgi:exosortase O
VEHLLSSWHIAAISSSDIIVLENGLARVDVPCSGLKSLGTGTLFLLAATWMEGRKLGMRWLLICVSNLFLLVCANITRVLLLVVITYVLKQPIFAEILHIPLGLIGLGCACGLSWLMLQTVPKQGIRERGSNSASLTAQALLIAFVIALIPINQLYHPQQEQPRSLLSVRWLFVSLPFLSN